MFFERMYVFLCLKHGIKMHIRTPLYVLVLYIWELSLVLQQFDACSWYYSHYDYNFMGLITLDCDGLFDVYGKIYCLTFC
jgi:hypothetical protein